MTWWWWCCFCEIFQREMEVPSSWQIKAVDQTAPGGVAPGGVAPGHSVGVAEGGEEKGQGGGRRISWDVLENVNNKVICTKPRWGEKTLTDCRNCLLNMWLMNKQVNINLLENNCQIDLVEFKYKSWATANCSQNSDLMNIKPQWNIVSESDSEQVWFKSNQTENKMQCFTKYLNRLRITRWWKLKYWELSTERCFYCSEILFYYDVLLTCCNKRLKQNHTKR